MDVLQHLLNAIGLRPNNLDSHQIDRIVERANTYDIFPLVYNFAQREGMNLSPGQKMLWREHIVRLALLRSELKKIVQRIGSQTPYVLLKGEPLAAQIFGNRLARASTDIDLVVAPEHVSRVRQLLLEMDYRPKPGEEFTRHWAENQYLMVHEDCGVVVEIHWAIGKPFLPRPPVEQCLRTATSIAMDDDWRVKVLSPEMLFFQLCLHFHSHQGFLKGLVDIAAWYDRFYDTADFEFIEQKAQELGLIGLIQWPIHTLHQLTQIKVPMYSSQVDITVTAWSTLCARAMRDCLTKDTLSWSDEATLKTMARIGKAPGVIVQALTMLVVDGKKEKIKKFLRPIILGPHRVGRFTYNTSERLGCDLNLPDDPKHFRWEK